MILIPTPINTPPQITYSATSSSGATTSLTRSVVVYPLCVSGTVPCPDGTCKEGENLQPGDNTGPLLCSICILSINLLGVTGVGVGTGSPPLNIISLYIELQPRTESPPSRPDACLY